MDKLSSILPSSSRVTSVDLDEAPPARPGSPTFGRKVGVNSVKDRVTLSPMAKEIAVKGTLNDPKFKEASRAKGIEELNRRFFETRLNPVEARAPESEQIVNREIEATEEMTPMKEQAIAQYENQEAATPRLSIEA